MAELCPECGKMPAMKAASDGRCWNCTEDPEIVARRTESRRKGGKGNVIEVDLPTADIPEDAGQIERMTRRLDAALEALDDMDDTNLDVIDMQLKIAKQIERLEELKQQRPAEDEQLEIVYVNDWRGKDDEPIEEPEVQLPQHSMGSHTSEEIYDVEDLLDAFVEAYTSGDMEEAREIGELLKPHEDEQRVRDRLQPLLEDK